MEVQSATIHDALALYAISRQAHLSSMYLSLIPSEHMSRYRERYADTEERQARFTADIRQKLSDNEYSIGVAKNGPNILGYIIARRVGAEVQLQSIFVDPQHQGKGVGSGLMRWFMSLARTGDTLWLKVLQDNTNAQRMYGKYDFQETESDAGTFFGAKLIKMTQTY